MVLGPKEKVGKDNPNSKCDFASCRHSTEVQPTGTWWSCAAGIEGGKRRPSSGEQGRDLLTEETLLMTNVTLCKLSKFFRNIMPPSFFLTCVNIL